MNEINLQPLNGPDDNKIGNSNNFWPIWSESKCQNQ